MTKRIDRSLLAQQVGPLLVLLAELEPALGAETVVAGVREAAALPAGQRRIAQELVDRPELLTGQAAAATQPGVLRFIDALVRAGATTVVTPLCPRCRKQRPLGRPFNGLRLCAGCTRKAVAMPCGRCGKLRPPARRNDNGQPICQPCWWRDGRSWKACSSCGDQRRVAAMTEAGPICTRCRPRPELICGICGRTGRCTISRATGQPMCDRCRERWIVCSRCGAGASLKGGTIDEPLCAQCVNPDPAFWTRCGVCGITWQLTTAQCARCSLDRNLSAIFTAVANGTATPQLDQLRKTLVHVDRPDHALDWLNKPGVRDTLRAVALVRPTITHEALDAMPPSGTLTHIRSMLVAADALPPRDERLAALEPWIKKTIAERKTVEHQRVLHAYAVWHHLRRLRGRLDGQPASHQQVKNIHRQVADAAAFLDWLHARGLTLATCVQADLDQWLASKPGAAARSASFVRWATTHRHARLTAPATRWTGPAGPLDQDRRWADARRLLHEDTCPTTDRVAGLLILLYAQKLNVISTLTTQHIRHAQDQTLLVLGSRPIVLPAPLDRLVNELTATRQTPGNGLINAPSCWLFPGRWPGRPLTEEALARRLRALGLQPRQGRNTALFTLAAEVPAAILAKMLGIHIKAAIQWQQISSGDWTSYAAEVSQRTTDPAPGLSNSSNN